MHGRHGGWEVENLAGVVELGAKLLRNPVIHLFQGGPRGGGGSASVSISRQDGQLELDECVDTWLPYG